MAFNVDIIEQVESLRVRKVVLPPQIERHSTAAAASRPSQPANVLYLTGAVKRVEALPGIASGSRGRLTGGPTYPPREWRQVL